MEEFVGLFTADDASLETKKACTDFFNKSIAPLPSADVRRLLISDNDILRRVLTKMQYETEGLGITNGLFLKPCLHFGWLLLYKAIANVDGPQQQPEAALSKRLFCKLLLLDIPALTDAFLAVFNPVVPFFSMAAKHPDQKWVLFIHAHVDTALQVLDVFTWLLTETRKEGHIRELSRILRRLHGLNKAIFSLKQAYTQKYGASGDAATIRLIGVMHSLWLTGAVVIERFAASAPPECTFLSSVSSEIMSHGCTVPLSSPRFPGRQISQFRSDSVLRELLSELAGNGVTFNTQYAEALRRGTDMVCGTSISLCVYVCVYFSCFVRSVSLLWVRRNIMAIVLSGVS